MTNSRPNIPRQRAILDPVDVMLSGLGDHEVTVPRRPRAGLVTHGKATDAAQTTRDRPKYRWQGFTSAPDTR
jgi:hypothetical protein